jgi:hypothetical protein
MFLGHFAAALAASRAAPRVSLGTLFFAATFLDLIWPALLLLGVERVVIAPGITAFTPLDFVHYPISHSLVAVLAWAVLIGGICFAATRSARAALVVGALVASHWFLDLLVHRPDLPLAPGSATVLGLGLWHSVPATLALELLLFGGGAWLYLRGTRPINSVGRWATTGLLASLLLIFLMNVFGSPPPSAEAVAVVTLGLWLFVPWAFWADRNRVQRDGSRVGAAPPVPAPRHAPL